MVGESFLAAASDKDGTKDTASEEVKAPGSNRRGITIPCNDPYCAVAAAVAIPANARLRTVIIDSNR
jgi:hypothetical protein